MRSGEPSPIKRERFLERETLDMTLDDILENRQVFAFVRSDLDDQLGIVCTEARVTERQSDLR